MSYYNEFRGIPQKKAYNHETSLSLAILCKLTTKDFIEEKEEINNIIESWNYKLLDLVNITKGLDIDTQCIVMTNDENIVIAFRGSTQIEDWFANFQFAHSPGPFDKTKVHGGFQDALFPAVIKIINLINSANPAKKKIWLTGHSLGGALSSIFAGMLIENDYNVYGLYTFASPRPGNTAYRNLLNLQIEGPHYRVVNDDDFVPHLLSEPQYDHCGDRRLLISGVVCSDKNSWWEQKKNAMEALLKGFKMADYHTLDKSNDSYIPKLLEQVKKVNEII